MTRSETTFEEQFALGVEEIQPDKPEISLVVVLTMLLRHKRLIASVTALFTSAAAIAILVIPPFYKAEATILPPQQAQSSLAALASGAMGGLATSGMASQLGLKNPADLYVGILKSRTITDAIIERFHLQRVYDKKGASDTRRALGSNTIFTSGKDTLITIAVTDRDPRRAADIANAYVQELHDANSRLALTDASQRRLFFDHELSSEKNALADAEVALKRTQQATGLLIPSGQAEALIRSAAQLRAEIVSRQVELKAMQAYATEQNPKLQLLQREIAAMQGQLSVIEATGSGSKFEVPGNKMPDASLEYFRKMRDLKYHETLFELLAKQYEAARLDEARQAPVIQVVDRAVAPERRDGRRQWAALVLVVVLAFSLTCFAVLASEAAPLLLGALRQR